MPCSSEQHQHNTLTLSAYLARYFNRTHLSRVFHRLITSLPVLAETPGWNLSGPWRSVSGYGVLRSLQRSAPWTLSGGCAERTAGVWFQGESGKQERKQDDVCARGEGVPRSLPGRQFREPFLQHDIGWPGSVLAGRCAVDCVAARLYDVVRPGCVGDCYCSAGDLGPGLQGRRLNLTKNMDLVMIHTTWRRGEAREGRMGGVFDYNRSFFHNSVICRHRPMRERCAI